MEFTDLLFFGEDAQIKLRKGIEKLYNAVRVTMGPCGKYVILGGSSGLPIVTKDGVSVAKAIVLVDPIEHMGATICKQSALKTAEDASDGTTTAIVLVQKLLFNSSLDKIDNISLYRQGMQDALEDILVELNREKIENPTKEQLYAAALTSSNQDINIAQEVTDIVLAVGNNGIIEVKKGTQSKTICTTSSGYKIEKGYESSRYINKPEEGIYERDKDIKVLIIDGKLENFNLIIPILKKTTANKNLLVVVAEEFSADFLYNVSKNFEMNSSIIPIKSEEFGERKRFGLEDLAIYLNESTVYDLKDFDEANLVLTLGTAEYIKISKDYTILRRETGNDSAVNDRILQLKNLEAKSTNDFDKKKLKERIAKLSSAHAKIIVGGTTEVEIKEKFDRYEDAAGATHMALQHGILPGGGSSLWHISNKLYLENKTKVDIRQGYNLVINSIKAPMMQILENADRIEEYNKFSIQKHKNNKIGVNAMTGNITCNMLEEGIVDPFKVTESALKNAVSVASIILSTGAVVQTNFVIYNENED